MFRTQDEVRLLAPFRRIGESEERRPIDGIVLGRGKAAVSLVAGAHAEEPVGPETLRSFAIDPPRELLDRFRFVIVPHVNPDGEARNRAWMERWPDPRAFLEGHVREPPGRDIEFGYPDMRPENRAVAAFLAEHAPYALHMSLHGMAAAEGAALLIERTWVDRTAALREGFARAAEEAGLGLHDHDRKGEKGFLYIGPGFSTTPEGAAMRRHFAERGDERTARLFCDSSMEFVRGLGGDPLCLVTEVPLFLIDNPDPQPRVPTAYLAFRQRGEIDLDRLRPIGIETAMALQRRTLELGLEAVA